MSSTPESKKQSSISVTFISGETITKQAQAATTDDHSDQTANKQKSIDSSDGSISTVTEKKIDPETPVEKPKSSISVTFISGETITKQAQPATTDDNSAITAIKQQSANSSDGSISPEIEKKVNPETTSETTKDTEPVSSAQPPVSDSVSTIQNNTSVNLTPEIKEQDGISVTSISEETIIKQTQPTIIKDQDNQTVNTQQSVNTAHTPIPQESEKPDNTMVNTQAIANGNPRPRERVKSRSEGHYISESISDSSDEPEAHPNMADVGAGVALLGGAVAIGGVIAGSTAVTALGVTAVVVGSTCYLLEGK